MVSILIVITFVNHYHAIVKQPTQMELASVVKKVMNFVMESVLKKLSRKTGDTVQLKVKIEAENELHSVAMK
jgi:hypothetical protein